MYQNTELNRDNSGIVFFIFNLLSTSVLSLSKIKAGYGNDYLPWLYTQPLQPKGGC